MVGSYQILADNNSLRNISGMDSHLNYLLGTCVSLNNSQIKDLQDPLLSLAVLSRGDLV